MRVQRAWRGHFARKNILGNSAFVFRDLVRLASILSRHDWRVHKMPPPRFLEFVVFSRVTCAHLIRSCFCRFCCDVAAAARRASPVQAAESSSQTILHPSLPKTALPNVHMFVDTTVLFTFASYDKQQPLDRRQHSACAAGLCTLSPAAIVVSLQYSLRFSRRLLTPSRCAGKISVRISSF